MWLASGCKGELRDDDEFSQFESGRDCLFAESGGVVLVSAADFLDKAMGTKTLQQAGYLAAVQFRQVAAEGLILQSADAELAANDGTEEYLVVRIEHVEAAIAASFLLDALGKFVELVALLAPMFPAIWGSATFAMLVSSTSMKAANETTNAINHGFAFGFHGDCGFGGEEAALTSYHLSCLLFCGIY